MRLLLITDTYPPDINGVARTLSTFARGLKERGHEVTVVTTLENPGGENDGAPRREIAASIPLPGYTSLRIGFSSVREMAGLLRRHRPDVLYVATETPLGIASIRAAARAGIPVVSGFHTNFHTYMHDYSLPGLESFTRLVLRHIHNRTQRTLTPSADTAAMLSGWGIRDVHVLGRGVDTELFDPAQRSAELRRSWGADAGTPVAIYVGRVAPEKNLDLLIRAFRAFQEVHPGAPCVIVGSGPRLEMMKSAHPGFIYAGARTGADLARHYASGDVFIFPSLTETFGNVVLEAMASGLIPVAYDYAGPAQLVQTGRNGWLAPLNDEPAFLEQTRRAAAAWNEPNMRQAARESALQLGWQHVIEQFETHLRSVLPSVPQPASPARHA